MKPESEPPRPMADLLKGPPSSDDDGLIRWMLELSPAERLAAAQGFVDSVTAMKRARVD